MKRIRLELVAEVAFAFVVSGVTVVICLSGLGGIK